MCWRGSTGIRTDGIGVPLNVSPQLEPHVWQLPLSEAQATLVAAGIPHRTDLAQGRVVPEGQPISVARFLERSSAPER